MRVTRQIKRVQTGRILAKLKPIIILALLAVIAWLFFPQALNLSRVMQRIRNVALFPLVVAALLQVPRYLGTGFLMTLCSRQLGKQASDWQASAVALASAAAARLIPLGGAGGIAVRLAYLRKVGLSEASIAAYFVLQNLLGTGTLLALFLSAIAYQKFSDTSGDLSFQSVLSLFLLLLATMVVIVCLVRNPETATRGASALGSRLDASAARFFRRQTGLAAKLPSLVADLRAGISLGGASPMTMGLALFYSSWTIIGDLLSLHVSTYALGASVSLPTSILAYAAGSFAGSAAAMPAGIGITEGAIAAVYVAQGLSTELSVSIALLFRAISFWLPIPLGFLAGWRMRRCRAL